MFRTRAKQGNPARSQGRMEPEGDDMNASTEAMHATNRGPFNPRRPLTIQQARRLARSIQSPADVAAQLAELRAREEAARQPADAAPLVRSRDRKASSRWTDGLVLIAGLAVVALVYVVVKAVVL